MHDEMVAMQCNVKYVGEVPQETGEHGRMINENICV